MDKFKIAWKWSDFLSLLLALICFVYAVNVLFKDYQGSYFENLQHFDGRSLYVSGACWLAGKSPYTVEHFRQVWNESMVNEPILPKLGVNDTFAFVYPPTVGVLTIPLAIFPWETAKYLLDGVNVLALAFIVIFSALLLRGCGAVSFTKTALASALSLILHLPLSTPILLLGQTALLAHMACLGAVYFLLRQRFLLAGVFVMIASSKPYVSLLLFVYLLLYTKNTRFFVGSFIFVSISSLSVLLQGGDFNPLPEFKESMAYYASSAANSHASLPGASALLHSGGVNSLVISLMPLFGLLLTVGLTALLTRRTVPQPFAGTLEQLQVIALIFVLTAVFMPLHEYDYTIVFLTCMLLSVVKWTTALALLPGVLLMTVLTVHAIIWDVMMTPILWRSVGAVYLVVVLAVKVIWSASAGAIPDKQ